MSWVRSSNPLLEIAIAVWAMALGCGAIGIDGEKAEPPRLPVGVYHQPGRAEAVNLEILEDGTFRWALAGCDYRGRYQGRWEASGEGLRLLPSGDDDAMAWIDRGLEEVPFLVVRPGREGTVTVVPEGEGFQQVWVEGGVCPSCWESGYICPSCGGKIRLEPCDNWYGKSPDEPAIGNAR